jgi:hypothetical protein
MKSHVDRPWGAILEACSTLLGWTLTIVGVNFVSFFLGYWIGHRGFPDWDRAMRALTYVPLIWLGSSAMIAAYVMSAITWYLPIHFDLPRARWVMLGFNAMMWIVGIHSVVRNTIGNKFFSY